MLTAIINRKHNTIYPYGAYLFYLLEKQNIKMDLYKKLQKLKTFLIEDDEWIRNSMCLFFESEGCSLLAFETAEEGMDALAGQTCDIIISDYRLPGMNGLEFFRKVQKSHPHIIKILITAYGTNEVISKAKNIGVDDFIEKPFTPEMIETSLLHLIEEQRPVHE